MSETWNKWLLDQSAVDIFGFPAQILEREWNPTEDDKRAAWLLYVELRTRITTQPLHHLEGGEKAALLSLYTLFAEVRELLKDEAHSQADHFSELGFQFLNRIVRPFTAEWHLKSERGQLDVHDTQVIFHRQLSELQAKIRIFCSLLGCLATGRNYEGDDWAYEGVLSTTAIDGEIEFPQSHPTTLATEAQKNASIKPLFVHSFESVLADEQRAIKDRRRAVVKRFPDSHSEYNDEATPINLVGLALSGGGIRSATLCQGVIQGLARTKILTDVDYMSTVSGGGYFGTFLSSFLNVEPVSDSELSASKPAAGLGPKDRPFGIEGGAGELEHLRNNSRYLLAGGVPGLLKALSQLLYGAGLQLALVLFVLLLVSGFLSLVPNAWLENLLWGITLVWIIFIAGMSWALYIQRGNSSQRVRIGYFWEKCTFLISLIVAVFWFMYAVALVVAKNPLDLDLLLMSLLAFLFVPILLMTSGILITRVTSTGVILVKSAFLVAPMLFSVLGIYMGVDVIIHKRDSFVLQFVENNLFLSICVVVLFSFHLFFLNINLMTLHRFYKNRLSRAYSLGENGSFSFDSDYQPMKLSKLGQLNEELPYHLINTTLNGRSKSSASQARRGADFFLLSRFYCGSESTGYWPTKNDNNNDPYSDVESCNPDLDLPAAMAISGAAVSPNMGTAPLGWARGFLTATNMRLNYWFKKPNGDLNPNYPHFGYLLNEFKGKLSLELDYLNLSDGGHIENLGIYSLLRRKCKFIIAIDGEADLGMTRSAISRVVRLARQDMNIEINIDTSPFTLDKSGFTQSHFVVGQISYSDNDEGYLIYIKSSITGNEPDDVKDYRRRHPKFPHQTTVDQFFDEEQFEAYRALGQHMAEELLKPEIIGQRKYGNESLRTREFFECLASRYINY